MDYYKVNFKLVNDFNYSLTELENMIPWEREIYVAMLIQKIQKENERRANGG